MFKILVQLPYILYRIDTDLCKQLGVEGRPFYFSILAF